MTCLPYGPFSGEALLLFGYLTNEAQAGQKGTEADEDSPNDRQALVRTPCTSNVRFPKDEILAWIKVQSFQPRLLKRKKGT